MTPLQIKRKYQKRILAILNSLRMALIEAGHDCEQPYDGSDDEFRWSMLVDCRDDGLGHHDGVDITFRICESETYDGELGGVTFAVDVVEFGGRVLGGLCPYNYSDQVWTNRKDRAAVEERFAIFEQADPDDIVACVERSKSGQPAQTSGEAT